MAEMDVQKKKGAPSLRQALGAKGVTPTPDGGPQPVPPTPGGGRMPAGNAGPPQKYGGYVPGGGGFLPNDPNDPRSKGSPFPGGGGVQPDGGPAGGPGGRPFGPPGGGMGPQGRPQPPGGVGLAGGTGNVYEQWKQRQQNANVNPASRPWQPGDPWGSQPGQGWVLDPTWGGGQRPIDQPPMGIPGYDAGGGGIGGVIGPPGRRPPTGQWPGQGGQPGMTRYPGQIPMMDTNPQPYGFGTYGSAASY